MPGKYEISMRGGVTEFKWVNGQEGFQQFFEEFVVPQAAQFGLTAKLERGGEPAQESQVAMV